MAKMTKAMLERVQRSVEAYDQAIAEGYPPLEDGKTSGGQGIPSAARIAADRLGVHYDTVRDHVRKVKGAAEPPPPSDISISVEEVVQEHRLQRQIRQLKAENAALTEQLVGVETFRNAIEGVADPMPPVTFQRLPDSDRHAETAVLVLSDLQWGETIDLAAMDGLNSYSPEIARARLARVISAFCDLITRHWAGPPPERIILVLGGDLISGEIHEELAKTNGLLSIPALRDCAAHIAGGLRAIHDAVPAAVIDVISVPGNHGRTTRKPEAKLYAAHSYDTLVADLVEMDLKEGGAWPSWFNMWKPPSGDALIWIYGYRVLITHGDRIGSRGGTGFVGTAATVARGFKKLVMDYAGRNVMLDLIVCGHFHTALQLEEGICNGCLPGPSEYSRDLRFRPRPAVQGFLTFHPRRGLTQVRWIDAGDPSEGSLYEPKPIPKDTKPRFRIPAVGQRP